MRRRNAVVAVLAYTAVMILAGCAKHSMPAYVLVSRTKGHSPTGAAVTTEVYAERMGAKVVGKKTVVTEHRIYTNKDAGLPVYPHVLKDGRTVITTTNAPVVSGDATDIECKFRTNDSVDQVFAFYRAKIALDAASQGERPRDVAGGRNTMIAGNNAQGERVLVFASSEPGKPTEVSVIRVPHGKP